MLMFRAKALRQSEGVHLFAFEAFYQEGLSPTVLSSVPSFHFSQHVLCLIKSPEIILITNNIIEEYPGIEY